jgi:predicted glycoside hydrolase/deacetylase ChbG (UPF0249 family)
VTESLDRLGVSTTRAVLISASDAGLTYGVNEGIRQALASGVVGDASLLVVAPFAREAVARLGTQLGIQLALSAEHELLEMRPVTYSPSLLGGRGGFPIDASDAAEHADPDEVYREFVAQIERAKTLGVTPTFLTSHDDVVARHLALFDVFLDVAEEYALPIRHGYNFGSTSLDATAIARRRGHFVVDHTVNWTPSTSLLNLLEGLPEGISEVIVHPALDSPDVAAVLDDAATRVTALNELLTLTPADIAKKLGITTLTWPQITTSSH